MRPTPTKAAPLTPALALCCIAEIVEPLEHGRLCLSTVGELAQVLTPENRDEVIPRFFHLSKQEARAVVAELKPVERPPQREIVTTVRAAAAAATPARAPEPAAALELCALAPACVVAPGSPAELLDAKVPARNVNAPIFRADQPTFEPLTSELRRMHLTVTKRLDGAVRSRPESHGGGGSPRRCRLRGCALRNPGLGPYRSTVTVGRVGAPPERHCRDAGFLGADPRGDVSFARRRSGRPPSSQPDPQDSLGARGDES
ncbi:hypothetical protein [Anaeromyxobacter oryzae]|uniref:Uncharacterized protein n=1 Tax=Anaeromyxobacter oryzae TaxID=2918170 RepID=A0ABM7WTA4_9BACT|nr:hypothetical protein [Anaeromyxobacter oryzae]BDG02721.1 hypothetical protein AMOR_17170 [Anaeromyxobacter oryzae]